MARDPLDAVYAKTEKGRAFLNDKPASGTRTLRTVLILMDGRKPVRELLPAIQPLGWQLNEVQSLVAQGLLVPVTTAGDVVAASPPAAAASRQSNRSLAAAKFYALDMLARMLGHGDADLRERARAVDSASTLMAWIDESAERVKQVAGLDRAESFRARTLELMPPGAS